MKKYAFILMLAFGMQGFASDFPPLDAEVELFLKSSCAYKEPNRAELAPGFFARTEKNIINDMKKEEEPNISFDSKILQMLYKASYRIFAVILINIISLFPPT